VEEDTNKKNRNTAGYHVFSNIDAAIEPCLELIVEQAGERTSFPLKRSTRIQEIVFVLAPPDGSRLNTWTKGLIHRDFSSTEVSGSTLLCCV
jgi:hypothetical protein